MAGDDTDHNELEDEYSKTLLKYLDELMLLFEKIEIRNFSMMQKKILIQNLFRNISNAIDRYFSLEIENSELYQSVLVQTTSVLKSVSSQLEKTDDLVGLKQELNTKIQNLIIRIINTRSTESYFNAITTSHFVGEFLNDIEIVVFFPKPPLSNSETYYDNVLLDFDYFHSMTLVFARPILQLKLLPREWISSWSKNFFLHVAFLVDYLKDLNLRQFIITSSGNSITALRKFLDFYVLIAILSYKLHSISMSDFLEIIQPLGITGEDDSEVLESVFRFSSTKITNLMEIWTGLVIEIKQSELNDLDQLNEYGFFIGKSLGLIADSLNLLSKITKKGIIGNHTSIDYTLSSIRNILTYFQVNSEVIHKDDIILGTELKEIDHIVFGLFCCIIYHNISFTLGSFSKDNYMVFLEKSYSKIGIRPRSMLLYHLLIYVKTIKNLEKSNSEQLENLSSLIENLYNPFDEISARLLRIIIMKRIPDMINDVEKELQKVIKIIKTQMGISHLKMELFEYIESLSNGTTFNFRLCSHRINLKIISDPFSLIKPGWDGEIMSDYPYIPFNLEADFVLSKEFFA